MKYTLLEDVRQNMVEDPHVLCKMVHSGKLTLEEAVKYKNRILREEIVKAKYLQSEFEYLNDLIYEIQLNKENSNTELLTEASNFNMKSVLIKGKKLSQKYTALRDEIKDIHFKDKRYDELRKDINDTMDELRKLAKDFYKNTITKKSVMGIDIKLFDASANPKMFKSLVNSIGNTTGKYKGVMTFALYLSASFPLAKLGFSSPDELKNTCPLSSPQCRKVCLTFAGGSHILKTKLDARARKTWWWAIDEDNFDVEPAQSGDLLLDINKLTNEELKSISDANTLDPQAWKSDEYLQKKIANLKSKDKTKEIQAKYEGYNLITSPKGKWRIKFKGAERPFGYIDTYDTTGKIIPTKTSFLDKLKDEILALKKFGDSHGFKIEVRLNGTSDLDLYRDLKVFKKDFKDVDFYDYTKVPNYIERQRVYRKEKRDDELDVHYVFSRSEINNAAAVYYLETGTNVSFVFEEMDRAIIQLLYSKSKLTDNQLKKVEKLGFTAEAFLELKNKVKQLEDSGHPLHKLFDINHGGLPYYFYGYEVMDGDSSDARRLEYESNTSSKGKIIGLVEKGKTAWDSTRSKRQSDIDSIEVNKDEHYFKEFVIRSLDLLRFKPEVFFKDYTGVPLTKIFPPETYLLPLKGDEELYKHIPSDKLSSGGPRINSRNISIESVNEEKLRRAIKKALMKKYNIKND